MKKIILVVAAFLILGTIITIVIVNNNKLKDQPKVELKDGKSNEDVILDKVTFSDITTSYDSGVTTLTAKMLNNTEKIKNIKVEIILKDDDDNKLKSMFQVVEDLQPGRPKVLTTGIAGDYSHVTKIEFKIVE